MSGDVHVRFCEGLGVKFPRATLPVVSGPLRLYHPNGRFRGQSRREKPQIYGLPCLILKLAHLKLYERFQLTVHVKDSIMSVAPFTARGL